MFEHEFLQQIPAYAIGGLSGSERKGIDDHLDGGCEVCEAELLILLETSNLLPHALPAYRVPAGLKKKVNDRIDRIESQRPVPATASTSFLLRIAAAVAVVAIGALLFWRQQTVIQERKEQISMLELQLKQQRSEINWLRDPSVQLAMLTGLADAPGAHGKMIWSPAESKGMFYADALPKLASGKSYQLWVIGSKGPVSAGVFEPNQQGAAIVTITQIGGAANGSLQFAVTIEPRGGLAQPSGAMVLAGKPL